MNPIFFCRTWINVWTSGRCNRCNPWHLSGKPDFPPCASVSDCFYHNDIYLFYVLSENVFSDFAGRKKCGIIIGRFYTGVWASPREKEVFSLIKEGRSNSEIANDLYISENTVKFHIKNILKKTACSNRTELIALFKEA